MPKCFNVCLVPVYITIKIAWYRFLITISMAGKKSKDKGKGYERDVALFLSETYNDHFIKVPYSGAMVGGVNAHRKTIMTENQVKSFKGDIIPPDNWNRFHCEAKFYKDFSFHSLFWESNALLNEWIDQVREAEDPDDFNLICMKFNYKGQWVCVEKKHNFVIKNSIDYKEWIFCAWDNFWTKDNIMLVKSLNVN